MTSYFTRNAMMRWGVACLLAGLLGLVAGCGSAPVENTQFAEVPGLAGHQAATDTAAPGSAATPATQPATGVTPVINTNQGFPGLRGGGTDLLRVGEGIEVVFTDLPFPVSPFKERIKEDGTITLMENQTFTAANKTRGELEREIRERYVPKFFLRLTVTVTPTERFYYVGGEVKMPQRQIYVGPITVMRAIQSCGDFTDFANRRKVQLTRVDGTSVIIDAKKAIKDAKYDLEVYPGDHIHVPRTIWIW